MRKLEETVTKLITFITEGGYPVTNKLTEIHRKVGQMMTLFTACPFVWLLGVLNLILCVF